MAIYCRRRSHVNNKFTYGATHTESVVVYAAAVVDCYGLQLLARRECVILQGAG